MNMRLSSETAATLATAVQYYFPVYEMARTRYMMLHLPKNPARREANVFFHQRALATHRARTVTTPNTDTLYSSVWLDLKASPLFLSVPPVSGRYWSLALMDVFTNNFAMLGSRMGDGLQGRPTELVIAGPDESRENIAALYLEQFGQAMPEAMRIVRSPGSDVWMLARWLVDSVQDSLEAHKIQDATQLRVLRPAATPWVQATQPEAHARPDMFVDAVNEILSRNPVPADEREEVQAWRVFGLGGPPQAWQSLDPQVQALWSEHLDEIIAGFTKGFMGVKRMTGPWTVPDAATGNFGKHHALRARVALGGLGALEPAEAVYLTAATDDEGQVLSGAHRYRVGLPPGGIEAKAFWSLTLYEVMPDGRLFFLDNPLHRYALGDRSPGIVRRADGSFDLWLQPERPEHEEDMAAWLPAPQGEFRIVLRAYVPSEALICGEAAMPVIERLN